MRLDNRSQGAARNTINSIRARLKRNLNTDQQYISF
jgi:hypothetical protein